MTKFVLIVAALVASVAMASPLVNSDEQPGILSYPDIPDSREIDWNKYLDGDNVDPTDNDISDSDNKGNLNDAGHDGADQNSRVTDCGPTEEHKNEDGMKEWCVSNCFHTPSYCPATHCQCW